MLLMVAVSSIAFSDAIGGGLLDDLYVDTPAASSFCIYLNEERERATMPINGRVIALVERLGHRGRLQKVRLAGDALITGTRSGGSDVDVPDSVLTAAVQAGLIDEPTRGHEGRHGLGSAMPQHARTGPGTWTGELSLRIRNARDWDVGAIDVTLACDTVHLRHLGRELAVYARDRFREWLLQIHEESSADFEADHTRWMVKAGVTYVSLGHSTYTIPGESVAHLRSVI